jgi:hypothetical protein
MKPARGGKREGAGRKHRAIPRQAITVRLEPQDVAKLRVICKREGRSQAAWIAERISQHSELNQLSPMQRAKQWVIQNPCRISIKSPLEKKSCKKSSSG